MTEVFDNIPVELTLEKVWQRMRARSKNESLEKGINELIEVARPVMRPKAVYKVSPVGNQNGDSLEINGVRFTSRVLRINLEKVDTVYPFVVTCGREIDAITFPSDLMKSYLIDQIKETVVVLAREYLEEHLKGRNDYCVLARMAPGSGAADVWPITQQKEFFSIFGNVAELIGVKLTASCLMIPIKSVSGIFFPTTSKFESCMLCPRDVCPRRRAPYDLELVKQYRQ